MSVTPVGGVRYWYDATAGAFVAPGRPSLPVASITQPTINRDTDLTVGTYKPGPDTTGPYTVTNWVDVDPPAGSSLINITTPGTIFGRKLWGRVRVAVPGVIFRECQFMGPDPDGVAPLALAGCIENFGSNPQKFEIWDSVISPLPWVTERGRAALVPGYMGMHGGNVAIYRTEITNVHDGWNWIGPDANATTAVVDAQRHILQQSWVHHGLYNNNIYGPSDGQFHSDAFQTNFGKHLLIWGNNLGGQRDIVGYNTWPGGYNSGDDFWNSTLILQQEQSVDYYALIEDVIIKENWLTGGKATINHALKTTLPSSVWTGCQIINNRFGRRGSNWGIALKGSGPGTPGVRDTTYSDAGYYILKNDAIAATYSGNVIDETGAPAPVTRG